jgi:hypothetical protein
MSNPAANAQIGAGGAARYYGIPALAVQWLGNDGATEYVGYIFGSVEKDGDANVQVGVDNANEKATQNRTQRKRSVKMSVKAQSTTLELAEAIATMIPLKNDLVSIGHMTAGSFVGGSISGGVVTPPTSPVDPQIETPCAVVDSASARWSPEGELVIDFSLTVDLNPDGTFKAWVVVS